MSTLKMAEFASENGRPDIAKKLRQAVYVTKEANKLYPFTDEESRFKTGMKRVKAAKRGEIQFGPEA